MSVTYGFNLCCSGLSEEELEKFRTVVQNHPIGWGSSEEGGGGTYVFAYVESKCPGQFDDALFALEDAVHRVWHALGRYVEIDASVLYIEDTPSDSAATDEDAYANWLAEQ